MKKVVSFVLALCLLVGLCGCGAPIKVKKFSSEQEMQDYLQGVWYDDWSGDCFFFIDGKAYLNENISRADNFLNDLDNFVKQQGFDALSKTTAKDIVAEMEKEWLSDWGRSYQLNPTEGTLTYTEDGIEYILYIGEDQLCGLDGEDEKIKISDTPSFTVPGLIEAFEEVYAAYKPSLLALKRTPAEYGKALMELHPETKNYIAVEESADMHFYTDTGSNNYNAGLMWADSVLYVKRNNTSAKYTLMLSDDTLLIQDCMHCESWESLAADALALFGGDILTPEELVTSFRNEGKSKTYEGTVSSTTVYEYKTEIDGVTFEMTESVSSNNNSKMITLRF